MWSMGMSNITCYTLNARLKPSVKRIVTVFSYGSFSYHSESLVVLITTDGFSDKVTLEWNILGSGFVFDGFLVQVRLEGSDEWIDVSSLLQPDERMFVISGIDSTISFLRVIAVDQSKKEVSRSIPMSLRKFDSGEQMLCCLFKKNGGGERIHLD